MTEKNISHEPEADVFEKLYVKQRKKTLISMSVAALFAVLFAGSLAWGLTEHNKKPIQTAPGAFGQAFSANGAPGGGRMMNRMNVADFFSADKSVNATKVTEFLNGLPTEVKSNILTRFSTQIDTAVTDGTITSAQATALKAALGISQ